MLLWKRVPVMPVFLKAASVLKPRSLWLKRVQKAASALIHKTATTRHLYVVCIYGAICLQILFLKHNILLFCHEILNFLLHEVGHNIK